MSCPGGGSSRYKPSIGQFVIRDPHGSEVRQFVPGTHALVFFLLAAGQLTGSATFTQIGGYVGIISGMAAIYTGCVPVLNDKYGRELAPL